jgi:hypothetical protein
LMPMLWRVFLLRFFTAWSFNLNGMRD